MNILADSKISRKLYTIILTALVALVGLAGMNLYQIDKVYDRANYASINTVPSFNTIYEARIHFLNVRILGRDHTMNTDPQKMAALERHIQEQREELTKKLNLYEDKLISDPEDLRLLKVTQAALKDYYIGLEQILAFSRQNKNIEARDELEKILSKVAKVEEAFQNHIEYNRKLAVQGSDDALTAKNRAYWINGLVTTLMIVLLCIGGWMIANLGLVRPVGVVVENLKQLAAGRMDVTVAGVGRRDEIGDIARAAQVFKEFVDKLNAQSWLKSRSAEIMGALQQAEDLLSLTQTAVSMVAPAVGAGHGAFYVADTEGNCSLLATYGCRERKQLNNSFQVGEGLVGQCVMERTPIMITAPKDYIRINSGLGDGTPACVMVLPVMHRDRVLGVLEMASFQQFGEREKNLLEALLPVLATSMEILDRNLRTRELLVATQEQAERMEKQAAQLEEQSVEMEAQQAELKETEHWFRSIIETAPDGMLVVDDAGRILLANPKAEEIFGYASGELAGGQIEQLVPAGFVTEKRTSVMGEGPQIRGRRKDGSEIELNVALSPLPTRGTSDGCVSVAMRAS
jgi:PAS domain S-box-containing protein